MKTKVHQQEGSIYPLFDTSSKSVASIDQENKPLEQKYRKEIPKSKKKIKVGSEEKLKHGTLKCFVRDGIIVVGLYKGGKKVGYELLYKPKDKKELMKGTLISEWKFDMQNKYFLGTAWSEETKIAFWTVEGLRKNGKYAKGIDIQ